MKNRDFVEQQYRTEQSTVNYWLKTEGSKDPLILLHGFGGDAIWTWANNIPALSHDRPILIPDLLWFGDSFSTLEPTLSLQAKELLTVIQSLGWTTYDIVGVSYGGFVALQMLSIAPSQVDDLILLDSPGSVLAESDGPLIAQRFQVESVEDLFVPTKPTDVQELINLCYKKPPPPLPPIILEQTYHLSFSQHHHEKRVLLRDLANNKEALSSFQGPWPDSLVIWGEYDQVFPLEKGQQLAELIGAEFHVIPNSAHSPNVEFPRQFEELVFTFLEQEQPVNTP